MSMRHLRNADQRSNCGRGHHRPQATKVATTTPQPQHTDQRPRPACLADAGSEVDATTASDRGGVILGGERACRGRR